MNIFLQLLILILLLFLSAFFSSAETALTTANKIRIRALAEEGNQQAVTALKITEQSGKMLSAILIGNNLVNISASSLATTITMYLFGSAAVGITTGVLTLLVLIFGEITPKRMAAARAEKLALSYSRIIWILMKIMTPLIFIVDHLASLFLRLLGVDPDESDAPITEQELRSMVDTGHEDGVLEEDERDMILNVFDFGDSEAKDIMVPRADIISVSVTESYQEIFQVFAQQKFSRLPVYENDRDNIVGILNLKDFAFLPDPAQFQIRKIMHTPHFTFETKKNSELMVQMRENFIGMSIVLDEYGTAVGLITMEDLLEELVGEIRDEYDTDEKDMIRKTGPGEYLVDGSVKLDDLNDALELSLKSEDYDSIAGFVMEHLEHLPQLGESVTTADGTVLKVEKMGRRRIAQVHLYMPDTDSSDEKPEGL